MHSRFAKSSGKPYPGEAEFVILYEVPGDWIVFHSAKTFETAQGQGYRGITSKMQNPSWIIRHNIQDGDILYRSLKS